MSATGCVMLCLILFFFTADFNNVISQVIPPSSTPSSGVGQCSDGERTCPTSKACYQNYQICDSYDDCGNSFDEIECPRSPEICQHVLGNSSAFQDACTRSVIYVPAAPNNGGEEETSTVTDGILYFPGPANNYSLLDAISFSTVDFPVGEFGYLRLVLTPFSSVTSDSLEPVILVLSNAIVWVVNDGSYEILLRSPIRANPSVIDMVRLEVSYVINSSPSASNPYLPPSLLTTTSFRVRYRFYYDQCASILSEGETGVLPIGQNSCLLAVKDYATYTNDAALQRVYCEPRERVQVAYDLYSECFEIPLPVQPWQLPSTSGPSTVPASTSTPMFAPSCDQVKEVCPVSRGCFNQSQVCDSYNDCGTGFDESNCSSLSDEEGTTCQEVHQNASLFNSLCAEFRTPRDPFTSDDIQLIGLYLFAAPQGSRMHIESINVTTPAFTPRLSGDVYAIFSIAIIDQQRQTVNSATLTAELRVTDKGILTHNLPLRVPLPVSSADRIEVYIQRTLETGPPSPQNPYQGVSVGSGAVRMNFVNYRGDCGSVPQNQQGPTWNLCLQSAWDFTKASERMFSMGLTCQPLERIHFISNMYSECFDEPSIVQISRNNSVVPGQEVSLICAARGTPVPTVQWLVPDDLIVSDQLSQSTTTGASTIIFTGEIANMQYRFECIAESYVGEKRAVRFVTILGKSNVMHFILSHFMYQVRCTCECGLEWMEGLGRRLVVGLMHINSSNCLWPMTILYQ
nr:uncharacterized protein LOC129256922 [Lytechinus pictus]